MSFNLSLQYLAVTGGTKNPVVIIIIGIAIVIVAVLVVMSIVRGGKR